jgi:hypothetical protein
MESQSNALVGIYCFFEMHGPYDSVRTHCTPDFRRQGHSKEMNVVHVDLGTPVSVAVAVYIPE